MWQMLLVALFHACGTMHPFPAAATSQEPRVTVTYQEAKIEDVVASFATFSSRKIVVEDGVNATVTVDVRDQPWDLALRSILASRNLIACEAQDGTIIVGNCDNPLAHVTSTLPPVTLEYQDADLRQVAQSFSQYTGRTIIVAPGVSEYVTTTIRAQQWNTALASILTTLNLTASEDEHGVITIDRCH